jgi:hypothetical protein
MLIFKEVLPETVKELEKNIKHECKIGGSDGKSNRD